MATTAGTPGIDQAMAAAFLGACPDAFIAVDTDFNVILWNPAAERLLGWRAEEVIGAPPPHLDAAQEAAIREILWEPDAETFPELEYRTHADGHVVPVVILSETTLRDAAGQVVGWGRFLRGVEGGELHLSLRNDLSVRFVEAVRGDEVRAALAFALEQLLGVKRAVILHPDESVLRGHLGIGMPLEEAEHAAVAEPAVVRRVTRDRIAASATVLDRPALLVPMGPRDSGTVLALLDAAVDAGGDTIPLVTALAGEAWAALRRVELVAELEAKVEILQATAGVATSAGLDLDEVLAAVCAEAARAVACERAAIYLGQGDDLALAHLHGADRPAGDDGAATAAHLLAAGGAHVLPDVHGDAATGPWHGRAGAVAVLGVPLTISDRTVGVLVLAHTARHGRGFTSLCRLAASAIARQAALAIENAQLFTNERTAVRSLREANQLKADYVDGICHDLRSPLTSLLGFVRTLRRLDEDATAAERREYLAIMERQAMRLMGLIEDMLVGARLEAGRLQVEDRRDVDMVELVADVLSVLPPERRRRVAVSGQDGVLVRGDRRQLERVVQNLVDNALNHTPATAGVEVVHAVEDRTAVLRVRDHGPGIPDELQANLFTRYGRGGSPATGSTGLGLYIVRGIVAAHGGIVTATSTPGDGACFEVRLPSPATGRPGTFG